MHTTAGASQQGSPSGSQNWPSRGPVQLPQSEVHSPSRQQLQQSASVVHAPPSGTHIEPQRNVPSALGAQMPLQHRSPNAHSSPSGRQQICPRGVPGVQTRPGGVEQHGSPPSVHSSPASTQLLPPPKQREKPAPVGSQPIRPPPFGQQFEVAPLPPQTSPTGTHEPTFAQRMIGRPSEVMPAARHAPEQHSSSLVQRSSWTRQPPRNWQRATGSSPTARHTVEQQEPLKPSSPHGSPAVRQAPGIAQKPSEQRLLQHSSSLVHGSPAAAHPALGAQAHPEPPAHGAPVMSAHLPLQQSVPVVHAAPKGAQIAGAAHVPSTHMSKQHCSSLVQGIP